MHLDALGVNNYQAMILSGGAHSLANWPVGKEQALTFLATGFAGVPPRRRLPPAPPGSTSKQLLNISTRAMRGADDERDGRGIYCQRRQREKSRPSSAWAFPCDRLA